MDSPENIRPKAFPRPPAEVCISILGLIQTIEPFSVIILSPALSSQITTGVGSPLISYFIVSRLSFYWWYLQYIRSGKLIQPGYKKAACQRAPAGCLLFGGPVTCGLRREIGIDKAIQIAVHYGVDVAGLIGGAVVLHHLVGHEDVGADLTAPLYLQLDAF